MGFQNPYALTMTHNLQIYYLLSLPHSGDLITTQLHPGIPEMIAMKKLM